MPFITNEELEAHSKRVLSDISHEWEASHLAALKALPVGTFIWLDYLEALWPVKFLSISDYKTVSYMEFDPYSTASELRTNNCMASNVIRALTDDEYLHVRQQAHAMSIFYDNRYVSQPACTPEEGEL